MDIIDFVHRKWIWGIPSPIWLKNIAVIADFIKNNNLKPVPEEHVPSMFVYESPVIKEKITVPRPIPFPGGIRAAHLHFKNDIYLLNEEQWKSFTTGIMKDFQAKLSKVKTVSFEQAIELSEAIDSLI